MSAFEYVSLGDCCEIVSGATPKTGSSAYWGGDILWATPKDLSTLRGFYIGDTSRQITDAGLRSCSAALVPAGSVLLSSRAPIGLVAINTRPLVTNQGFKNLVPRLDLVNSEYLAHWLRANRSLLVSLGNGATFKEVSKATVAKVKIPLPSVSEQRRIVRVLDRADSLRAKRRESISVLDSLPRAIFLEMFGDPVSNPMSWPMNRFAEIGTLDRGVSKHRPRNAPELLGGAYPLIQTGDVAASRGHVCEWTSTYSDAGLAQSRLWPKGTLCITIAANIAKTGILGFDACFPDSVVGFASDINTVEYVQVWLSFLQKNLERLAPESAQKNINLAVLRQLEIPDPGPILISSFADRVRAANVVRVAGRAHLAELDALFASLQHRAFQGEMFDSPPLGMSRLPGADCE